MLERLLETTDKHSAQVQWETLMTREIIKGYQGCNTPCISSITGKEKLIVLISHGFGSNKESTTATAVADALSEHGIGTYCYDFPAHGESQADSSMLRI